MSFTPEQTAQLDQVLGNNPAFQKATSYQGSSDGDWYSKIKQGAYRVTPAQKPTPEKVGLQRFNDTASTGVKNVASDYVGKVVDTYKDTIKNVPNDIQAGAEDIQKGGALNVAKGVAKGAVRTAADVVPAVFAPVSAAIGEVMDKTGATKGLEKAANWIDQKTGFSDHPAVQEFAMKHPNAAEDFNRVLNLIMAKGENTEIKPENMVKEAKMGVENVANKVGDVAGSAVEKTSEVAHKVGEAAKETGQKVTGKLSDSVTPVEPSVRTELLKGGKQEMLNKFGSYLDQAEKAVKDNSQSTPLELAGTKAEEALSKYKDLMSQAGQEKQAALKENGTKEVPTMDTVKKFDQLLNERLGSKINSKGEINSVAGRKSIIANSASDLKLVRQVKSVLTDLGMHPTLQEVNDAIDGIQGELYKSGTMGAEPINSKTEGLVKQVIGDLNSKAKEVGGEQYKGANARYADLTDTYHTLNKALGVDANKGASLMKQLFSPNGSMPRKLFAEIKEKTGIDLVNEATLAKFAMENVGDTRQANLLNEIIHGKIEPSSKGAVRYLIDKGIQKLQNPAGKAKRIIESRGD